MNRRILIIAFICNVVVALTGCNTYRREFIAIPIQTQHVSHNTMSSVKTHALDVGDQPPSALRDLHLPGQVAPRTERPDLLLTYRASPSAVRGRTVNVTRDSGGNTAYMVVYRVSSSSTLIVEAPAFGVKDTLVSNREDTYEIGSRYDRNVLLGGRHNGSVPRRGVVVMTMPTDVARYEANEEAETIARILLNPDSAGDVVMQFNAKYGPEPTAAHIEMISSTEDAFTKNIATSIEQAASADEINTLRVQLTGRRGASSTGSDDWGMYTIALGILCLKQGNEAEATTLFESVADPHDFVGRAAHSNLSFVRTYRIKN